MLDSHSEQAGLPIDERAVLTFIMGFVANDFAMNSHQLMERCRKADLLKPRMAAAFLMHQLTTIPIVKIGAVMGRHHSSVIRMCQRCVTLMQNDETWTARIEDLKSKLAINMTDLS